MAITRDQIIAAVHQGFRTANGRYEKWSNGVRVTESAVEGLITSCIAGALHARQEVHEALFMEMTFSEIWRRSDRAPPTNGRGRRADIVLCNQRGRPTGVIEVKRKWNAGQCLKDVDRIQRLVLACNYGKGGSLRRGFLALMIAKQPWGAKSAEVRIREQCAKIEAAISLLSSRGLHRRYWLSRFRSSGRGKTASLVVEVVYPNPARGSGS